MGEILGSETCPRCEGDPDWTSLPLGGATGNWTLCHCEGCNEFWQILERYDWYREGGEDGESG